MNEMLSHLDGSLLEVEPLLHDRRQFPDASALLPQYVLRPRRQDDDLRARRRDPHLHPAVAILSQLPGEELVQFCLEDSILDELKHQTAGNGDRTELQNAL